VNERQSTPVPDGTAASWQNIARELRPFVRRRVASDADADDVLQEVALRLYRGLSSLDDEGRFGPWMMRVARNAIADHQRARARHPVVDEPHAPEPEPAPEPEDAVAQRLAQVIALFVVQLPSPYREAITLTELQGLTQKEAAELVGISLSGMKSRVQRGRARLRELLEECCAIAVDSRNRVVACEPRSGPCCGAPSPEPRVEH
jgi:RNA polymerase sigma-70 factor (ECF subfamily)